ncbi:hypothetical protein [Micromonospora sp. WMMD714]|uniref:hypothetical protein n=1 Tax=Micromonospora sp. WMMD714 TaxID=3016097 RepID=UPI00249A163A|nr:hypothetical protein [Micromonospora sp. WMMD714]WFE66567.1 hypothetical protein O7625_26140 [Micromonospora sp. WMMD714]
MSKTAAPRHLRIDDEDVVVLPAADYERLASARRQLGAREARNRSLTDQVKALSTLLTDIRQIVDSTPDCCGAHRDADSRIRDLADAQRIPRPPVMPAPTT